jgi:hypothetical protein
MENEHTDLFITLNKIIIKILTYVFYMVVDGIMCLNKNKNYNI